MRLFEIDLDSTDGIRNFILENCKSYLRENINYKKEPLYRGVSKSYPYARIINSPKDRSPLSTSRAIHDVLVDAFEKANFKANRQNSLFCTGSIKTATSYSKYYDDNSGQVIVIYPIGYFEFTWSSEIEDMFSQTRFNDFIKQNLITINLDKTLVSKNKTLLVTVGFALEKNVSQIHAAIDKSKTVQDFINNLGITKEEFSTVVPVTGRNTGIVWDNTGLTKWIKDNYSDENIQQAISSGNEIMVNCDKLIAVPEEINTTLWK